MTILKVVYDDHKPVKIWTKDIDDASVQQLVNVASMPFIFKHIAVMPDVHLGIGATIGSVIPTQGAIMPAAVGVDIGCGMMAMRLEIDHLPDDLVGLREDIERAVPHGGPGVKGSWIEYENDIPAFVLAHWGRLGEDFCRIIDSAPGVGKGLSVEQLGTLGTGNHFIEICIDEEERVWIVIHSGSRGPGNRIGRYFTNLAKRECTKWFIDLPDPDLAYLIEGTQEFDDYIFALNWATEYARINRQIMMTNVSQVLGNLPHERIIDCIHNYAVRENHFGNNVWVTRKGAIQAREGTMGIIPGSMGDKSYIVRGKGNKESFCSAAHGAGRRMSRAAARKEYTVEDLEAMTVGVECPKDEAHIDEIPMAYKPIDEIMENQTDLVEVVHTLKQVVNVKG